jgi:hypothetical protein
VIIELQDTQRTKEKSRQNNAASHFPTLQAGPSLKMPKGAFSLCSVRLAVLQGLRA